MRETAGERIQWLSRPIALPGCCSICGYSGTNVDSLSDRRAFVDWNLDLEFYGRVYICSTCILQAVNGLGWLGPEQVELLHTRIQTQEAELIILREQNERLRSSMASLLGQSDTCDVGILPSPTETVGQGSDYTQGTVDFPAGDKSDFNESVSSEGFSSVPADSDDDYESISKFGL